MELAAAVSVPAAAVPAALVPPPVPADLPRVASGPVVVGAVWIPPPPEALDPPGKTLKGVLGGARLFEQPAWRHRIGEIAAFLAVDTENVLEIGVDDGLRLCAMAMARPAAHFLGLEVRKAKVAAARPPENCHIYPMDARTALGMVLPSGCLDRVDLLFPTPSVEPSHLLLRPDFVRGLRRCLRPQGVFDLQTDVEGLYWFARHLFRDWHPAEAPPDAPRLSRRQWVARRDGLVVHRLCVRPPQLESSDSGT
jgi:tRNA G46 methylase TrmB